MPFVRVSRDKRGTEHVYLVDVPSRQGRSPRPRVLYVFRTPPGVALGRQPFDPEIRRLLEGKYPELTFDWEELSRLPAPPPDVEPWRERRRAERAAKEAARAERAQMEAAEAPANPVTNDTNGASREAAESMAAPASQSDSVVPDAAGDAPVESESLAASAPNPAAGQAGPASTGRRRRRGRRRGRSQAPAAGSGPAAPSEPETVE